MTAVVGASSKSIESSSDYVNDEKTLFMRSKVNLFKATHTMKGRIDVGRGFDRYQIHSKTD